MRDSRADAAPPERFSDHLREASRDNREQPAANRDEKLESRNDGVAVDGAATQPAARDSKPTGDADQAEAKAGSDSSTTPRSSSEQTSGTTADQTATTNASTAQHNAVQTTDPSVTATTAQGESQASPNPDAQSQQAATTAATKGIGQAQPITIDQSQVTASQQATAQQTAPASSSNEAARTATAVNPNTDAAASQTRVNTSNDTAAAPSSQAHSINPALQQTGQTAGHSQTNDDPQQQQSQASTRQSQELQQRLQQAINNTHSGETEPGTAAERRAGQVNAAVQFEQSTGSKPISIDTSSLTTTTTSVPAAPGIDLGTVSRAGQSPILLPSGQPVDEGAMTHNVVRGLSALVNQRGGVMHMRLDPPELGQLRVQMSMNQGTVNAQFEVATTQAQTALERNIATLRTALERHGLTVERISVNVHQSAQGQQTAGQNLGDQSADQSSQNQQHNAGGGESRGRGEQSADDRQRQSFAQFAQDELADQSHTNATFAETGTAS